jgi:transposase-like protein
MKRTLILAFVLLAVTLGAGIDDYLADMKTTKEQVQNLIQNSFGYGSFTYPLACSKIPMGKRVAVVRAVGEFAKTFTTTDTFRKWYAEYRENQKPAPTEEMKSMTEARKEQIAAVKAQLAEYEKAAASAPTDQKAMYKGILESMKTSLKDLENADKSKDAEMDEAVRQSNAEAKEGYRQKLAEWERDYPVGNPRPLLKQRLQTFLDATGDIDFNARLIKKGKVMVFESEEYESKDSNWKLAYRAGKEATQAARAIAATWMRQL